MRSISIQLRASESFPLKPISLNPNAACSTRQCPFAHTKILPMWSGDTRKIEHRTSDQATASSSWLFCRRYSPSICRGFEGLEADHQQGDLPKKSLTLGGEAEANAERPLKGCIRRFIDSLLLSDFLHPFKKDPRDFAIQILSNRRTVRGCLGRNLLRRRCIWAACSWRCSIHRSRSSFLGRGLRASRRRGAVSIGPCLRVLRLLTLALATQHEKCVLTVDFLVRERVFAMMIV